MVYPEEFTGGSIELVYKDGKKYFKRPVFRLSHYSYEPVPEVHQKTDFDKLKQPDIIKKRD